MKYKANKPESWKLRDARANLSYLVNTTGKTQNSYIIASRKKPKAVLISYETAEKYLPRKFTNRKDARNDNKTDALTELKVFLAKQKPTKRKQNISGNIDKILYHI